LFKVERYAGVIVRHPRALIEGEKFPEKCKRVGTFNKPLGDPAGMRGTRIEFLPSGLKENVGRMRA